MLADTGMRHREELGAMTRSWVHFEEAPFPRIVVPSELHRTDPLPSSGPYFLLAASELHRTDPLPSRLVRLPRAP